MEAPSEETVTATVMNLEEEDDEHDSKERVLQKCFLQEWNLVKSFLNDTVSNSRVSDASSVHQIRSIVYFIFLSSFIEFQFHAVFVHNRFLFIFLLQMDKYQDQGQLLEPYLESIIPPLMNIIRSKTIKLGVISDEIFEIINPICIVVYSVIKVCGYKSVIKFFPHQVSDLELAVSLLEKCHHKNSVSSSREESTGEFEAKCVMLLWLYILVLVPFDLSSVDTSIASSDNLSEFELVPLVLRIIGFCKDYLSVSGRLSTMAGLVLSRLLTRPDMPKAFMRFIQLL